MSVASTVTLYNRKTVNVNDSPTVAIAAGADLRDKAGCAVKVTTGAVGLCDSQGERAFGIVAVGANTGEIASVAVQGRVQAVAGDVITVGALVTTQNDGGLEVAASGDYPIGIALEAAASGELFYMLIAHAGVVA